MWLASANSSEVSRLPTIMAFGVSVVALAGNMSWLSTSVTRCVHTTAALLCLYLTNGMWLLRGLVGCYLVNVIAAVPYCAFVMQFLTFFAAASAPCAMVSAFSNVKLSSDSKRHCTASLLIPQTSLSRNIWLSVSPKLHCSANEHSSDKKTVTDSVGCRNRV